MRIRIHICPRCAAELIALTERRRRIFDAVERGLEEKEIAAELGIAPSTLHSQLQAIYYAIGVHNRVQAAVWWTKFKVKNPDLLKDLRKD